MAAVLLRRRLRKPDRPAADQPPRPSMVLRTLNLIWHLEHEIHVDHQPNVASDMENHAHHSAAGSVAEACFSQFHKLCWPFSGTFTLLQVLLYMNDRRGWVLC